MNRTGVLILACLLPVALTASAEVRLHALFSENAVLQQGVDVPVWGAAEEGEVVTVEFQGQRVAATAKDGRWEAVLKPLQPGGPFPLTVRGRANTLTRANILVGEVWLCSGQSNMGWGLGGSETREQIAAHADLPTVRFFRVKQDPAPAPKRDVDAAWEICTPGNAYSFSAVGYYFGRDLVRARKVPVGLIQSAIGGSHGHVWMPARYLEADPELRPLLNFWEETKERYAKRLAAYRAQEPALRKKYEEELAKARAADLPEPKPPQPPGDNPEIDLRNLTAAGYNGMIAPLQPFAIRGALWYQGENDLGNRRYAVTLPTLIRAWRETWGRGDFAFLIVQLPAYTYRRPPPGDLRWAITREIQWRTGQQVPNAATVVSIDCGNPKDRADLHPPLKEPVGQRLALAARARVYGEAIEYSGPMYDALRVEGGVAVVTFTHAAGLVARGEALAGFAVAGADGVFLPAQARIDGDTVKVSHPQVAKPVAVRYAWADYPEGNLYNNAGLPAAPFRTDDFPVITEK
jgi:sialate O-acetylesterase